MSEAKKSEVILPPKVAACFDKAALAISAMNKKASEDLKPLTEFYTQHEARQKELEHKLESLQELKRDIRAKIMARLKNGKANVRVTEWYEFPIEHGLMIITEANRPLAPLPPGLEKMIREYFKKYKNTNPRNYQDKIDRALQRHFYTDKTVWWNLGPNTKQITCFVKDEKKEVFNLASDPEWKAVQDQVTEINREITNLQAIDYEIRKRISGIYREVFCKPGIFDSRFFW